jgi:glycosyltransferase involved in cell wall biosynthesis
MAQANEITVSVLVMTYNHRSFIHQALDSVLEQQASFNYEILISEDCSTDGTREIVQEYQQRHPETVRLLLSERNIRSNAVVVRGIEAARGRYVALLDGDDYWTSPLKLQKQVDFLDSHPECSLCFHNATVVSDREGFQPWNWTPAGHPQNSTLEDLWMGNFIATCSTMFRKGLIDKVPAWYNAMFPITDWPLHLLNAEHGKIGYIDEVMGAYRYHEGGYYSPLSQAQKLDKTLAFYRTMNANLDYRYDAIIKVAISKYFYEWTEEYVKRREYQEARKCLRICLGGRPINKHIPLKRLLKLTVKTYLGEFLRSRKPGSKTTYHAENR